jgi:hypothetical protein
MALHPAINEMLKRYNLKAKDDYKNALKEIVQEIALLGLARQKFFDKAAFYGGTALRISHHLDRFSEDLDFEKLPTIKEIKLENYLQGIDDELKVFGLNLKSEKKIKTSDSSIDSAFIKGNTLEHLLLIAGIEDEAKLINKNDIIKVKLEVDLDPPAIASNTEVLFHHYPIDFSYRLLDLPSLFAGKLHAILCRDWKGDRVKGRDFYDFTWYIKKNISPNLSYLESKLRQSGHWSSDTLTMPVLVDLLKVKFNKVKWESAKKDVFPFVKDPFALDVWGPDFFNQLAKKLSVVSDA